MLQWLLRFSHSIGNYHSRSSHRHLAGCWWERCDLPTKSHETKETLVIGWWKKCLQMGNLYGELMGHIDLERERGTALYLKIHLMKWLWEGMMRTLATRFHFIRCWNARRKAPRGTLLISYHTIPYSKSYFPSMELYIYIYTPSEELTYPMEVWKIIGSKCQVWVGRWAVFLPFQGISVRYIFKNQFTTTTNNFMMPSTPWRSMKDRGSPSRLFFGVCTSDFFQGNLGWWTSIICLAPQLFLGWW